MSEYDKVAKVVEPKKKALAEAQETYNQAMIKLEIKRAQLAEIQVRIKKIIQSLYTDRLYLKSFASRQSMTLNYL